MTKVRIDMNRPEFQQQLYKLDKNQRHALLNTLEKLSCMTWDQVYVDKGLRWELISSKDGAASNFNIYSFRFSQKYRATAYRDGDGCIILGLFPDHDGAYK